MPAPLQSIDFSGNQARVDAALIPFDALNYMFWGKWVKWNTVKAKAVDPHGGILAQPVANSPIVAQRNLRDNNGNLAKYVEMPMFRQLVEMPRLGTQQLSGEEEERKINFNRIYVDAVRHGEKVRQGRLTKEMVKGYQIEPTSRSALLMHYARFSNFAQIPSALYKGFSYNVLNSGTWASDANVKVNSHPNFFTTAGGRVAWGTDYPGTAGYETNVATAVEALGLTHKLSLGFLTELASEDAIRRIPKLITKNGDPFLIFVAHPLVFKDLQKDPEYRAWANNVFVSQLAKENSQLANCAIYGAGFAVFDGGNAVYPLSASGGAITYGPTVANLNSFDNYSSYNKFGNFILGDNAIGKALAWDMEFTGEIRDHGDIETVGYTVGEGYARNQYINRDDGTEGQYLICDTSAIVACYADQPSY